MFSKHEEKCSCELFLPEKQLLYVSNHLKKIARNLVYGIRVSIRQYNDMIDCNDSMVNNIT